MLINSDSREFETRKCIHQCHGAIHNKNQMNEFKTCDKQALINEEGKLIWADVTSGACLADPSLLSRFFVLSFSVSSIIFRFFFVLDIYDEMKSYCRTSKLLHIIIGLLIRVPVSQLP